MLDTYGFSHSDIVLESRDGNDLVVFHTALDDLSAADVGKSSVIEQSGRESRSLRDVLRAERTNEDVVVEKSLQEAFLLSST